MSSLLSIVCFIVIGPVPPPAVVFSAHARPGSPRGLALAQRLRREGGNSQARAGGVSTGPNRRILGPVPPPRRHILCACAARESTWTRACAETTTGGGKQPGPGGGGGAPGRACAENTTGRGEDDVTPINLRERVEFSEAKRKLIDTFLKS